MKQRVLTGLAIVLTIALMFVLKVLVHPYFFDVFIYVITAIAAYEGAKVLAKGGLFNQQILAPILPGFLLIADILGIYYKMNVGYILLINLGIVLLFTLGVFLWNLMYKGALNEMRVRNFNSSRAKFSFRKAVGSLVAFVYPSLLMMCMLFINHIDELTGLTNVGNYEGVLSILALLTMFLIPMFTDTFAMFTGMLIGGKKLCPKISPKKTISGAIGGILWCILLSACVYLILGATDMFASAFASGGMKIWIYLIIVFIGSIIAQLGDLFESFLKRRADVKDSGHILPGHGGMLDRIDSYVFLAPFLLMAFAIVAIV